MGPSHPRMDKEHPIVDPTTDAAVAERIADSFARQGLMTHLGARLGSVGPGEVHIHLPMSPVVTQQHGYFHAGATGAIVDSAGGYAAATLLGDDRDVLTVEYKLNLLAPAIGDELEAIGTVIRSGRTLTVCRLEVHARSGADRTPVASGQQTVMAVERR